ncbi:hypothetical protein P7228_08895 [Altererythrobacter arenosus]|uniref:Lipoprotein n=1 Tax=Altererythrobacter arenosus TaxID=3032592 RepID=A0ABY8FM77_9SPHN|nr:hypothetical protein [Altererythrobacter sp. CAU 1644]WFL76121.1 hypothetical protein P7228_08895 [Altererythrobacter sp. CAU 1644]
MNKSLLSGAFLLPLAGLALSGCATVSEDDPTTPPAQVVAEEGQMTVLPMGAKLEPSGFISIGEVLATPYPANPPPEPASIDSFARRLSDASPEEQARLWEEANGSEEFQAEVQRLQQVLSAQEAGNFVQINLLRDESSTSDPQTLLGAEVWFKRDAAKTLAKYTDRPDIFARQGGMTEGEREALSQVWIARVQEMKWPSAISSDPKRGIIEVETGVTEEKFRQAARDKGWTWGDEVKFTFAAPPPPAFLEDGIASLLRTFTRSENSPVIQLAALGIGRVVLEDGCFRLDRGMHDQPSPLVMFGYDTQLGLDEEGYLIARTGDGWAAETYRIGEMGAWGGPNGYDDDSAAVRELRSKCGEGEIVNIGSPQSLRLFSLPFDDWLKDYALAKRLSYEDAWVRVIDCYKRYEKRGRSGLELRDRCITQFNR